MIFNLLFGDNNESNTMIFEAINFIDLYQIISEIREKNNKDTLLMQFEIHPQSITSRAIENELRNHRLHLEVNYILCMADENNSEFRNSTLKMAITKYNIEGNSTYVYQNYNLAEKDMLSIIMEFIKKEVKK